MGYFFSGSFNLLQDIGVISDKEKIKKDIFIIISSYYFTKDS